MSNLSLFEERLKNLRRGIDIPISSTILFQKWFWNQVNLTIPITNIKNRLFFGYVDISFITKIDFFIENEVVVVGFLRGMYPRFVKLYRQYIYIDIDLHYKTDYVFCVDQINIMKTEERLRKLINNLIKHSSKYIFLTCWSMDPNVPSILRSLHKTYWNFDNYVKIFNNAGFKLIARANYNDSLTMLYIFKKN